MAGLHARCACPHATKASTCFASLQISRHPSRVGCSLRCLLPFNKLSITPFSSQTKALANKQPAHQQRLKWKILARLAYYARIPFLVLSVYGIGYQQGIMDYSRDTIRMEMKLLDTILAGVGCISGHDRRGVLVANEGEWKNISERFHATQGDGLDDEYARVVMLRNVAIVAEKIVKVARAHVKQKLADAVKEATADFPPEVLEDEGRLYEALEEVEEVELWTNALRHMEVINQVLLMSSTICADLLFLTVLHLLQILGAVEVCVDTYRLAKCIRFGDSA